MQPKQRRTDYKGCHRVRINNQHDGAVAERRGRLTAFDCIIMHLSHIHLHAQVVSREQRGTHCLSRAQIKINTIWCGTYKCKKGQTQRKCINLTWPRNTNTPLCCVSASSTSQYYLYTVHQLSPDVPVVTRQICQVKHRGRSRGGTRGGTRGALTPPEIGLAP